MRNVRQMISAHFRRWGTVSAICFALAAGASCTPAQVAKIETGIPVDAALIGCVISTALSTGGNVLAVASACGGTAEQVVAILFQAATLPKGAMPAMVTAASALRTTPAFTDAFYNYPAPRGYSPMVPR